MSSKSKQLLRKHVYEDSLINFGLRDEVLLDDIIEAWSDFENDLNGRWFELEHFGDASGCILDMAAGVGSFVFRGLNRGYNVYGIEPESWKLEYIKMRIEEEVKYRNYKDRIKHGVGENLDFQDETFDLVSSYQTLEHVQDVAACIDELIRVTKPGGKIIIQAPDYYGFFEPHYLLPLLPKFSLFYSSVFLKMLRRPTNGLKTISWITSKRLLGYINNKYPHLSVVNVGECRHNKEMKKISNTYYCPFFLVKGIMMVYRWFKSFYQCEDMYIVIRK